MAKITEVMANLPRATMAKASEPFRCRIEAAVDAVVIFRIVDDRCISGYSLKI
jgi:hypothetical protein